MVEKGFDPKRIEAILHRTELGLKNKGTQFGLNLIMSTTVAWNHNEENPLMGLRINENIKRFKEDMAANPKFLEEKVTQYFLTNGHMLLMTMSPEEGYNEKYQALLDGIEKNLANQYDEAGRKELFEKGQRLAESQGAVEDLSSLPNLQMADIAKECRKYKVSEYHLGNVPTQQCVQPTNEIAFFRALLRYKY